MIFFLKLYEVDFPELSNIAAEKFRWKKKWSSYEGDLPADLLSTLEKTDKVTFPTIHEALRILTTLPITSCECERKISSLKLVKTWTRSTMGQEKLNSFVLLMTHRDIELAPMKVVDEFARIKPRRMNLGNVFGSTEDDD